MEEPRETAIVLLAVGGVLGVCVAASRVAARSGLPVFLVFVLLGMLCGEEGIGVHFDDYALAFRLGVVALALILFDAGLHTQLSTFRRYLAPSLVLATIGVLLTALLVGAFGHWLGFPWLAALLIGTIVSSTDAAAVFSVLRMGGVRLHERVGATLEVESGLNDPMAVILTVTITQALASGRSPSLGAFGMVVIELVVGALVGALVARLSLLGLRRLVLPVAGLYPILTVGVALLTFGAATVVHGSGFLAVYVAGMVVGSEKLPYRSALSRIHDFAAWSGQVAMFVVLGLLATPSRIAEVAVPGLLLGLFVALVARPLAVVACLAPFRFKPREVGFIAWVGLKGAVPIVLACIPVLARIPGALRIFDVVFFAVVVSAALQGSSVRMVTKWLRLGRGVPSTNGAVLEITATRHLGHELAVFEISPAAAVCDVDVSDIPFPEGSAAMLVLRADELLAPRGTTTLLAGDTVYVFCKSEDLRELELLFGGAREP